MSSQPCSPGRVIPLPTDRRRDWGRAGEEAAVLALKAHGYVVLERNVRTPLGELDIVARHGDTLVFVEVKTRRSAAFGPPAAAVDRRKQRKLRQLAESFRQSRGLTRVPCRFDVVAVEPGHAPRAWKVEIIPDAF